MKRILHGLVATLLVVGGAHAKTYTDHTFLAPRSDNTNIAMESTTWHKQTSLIDRDKFGGTVQATGFYEESNNKHSMGKYFGITNSWNGNSIDDFINVQVAWPIAATHDATHITQAEDNLIHIYDLDIFHIAGSTSSMLGRTLHDKLYLRPDLETYGIRLDYHQKLDKVVNGLFFKISSPLVHVKTSLGFRSAGGAATENLYTGSNTMGSFSGPTKSVIDYLTGNVVNNDSRNKQAALSRAKFHNDNSTTELADIDVMIGYNFLYKQTSHINATLGFTIPTSDDGHGDYLFEATAGNRGHWALGGGLDAAFQIWKKKNMSLDILAAFNYRYLFESDEARMPQIKWESSSSTPYMFGQYVLAGEIGKSTLFPLANVLMQDMEVTPGSHFDGMIDFAFNWCNFTFDLGYNLFAKAREEVNIISWNDNHYGIAPWEWDTLTSGNAGAFTAPGDFYQVINKSDLLVDACTNPSVVTHKIFGGIGWAAKEWKYPVMAGIGASYEFVSNNDALEMWALWLKLGVTF